MSGAKVPQVDSDVEDIEAGVITAKKVMLFQVAYLGVVGSLLAEAGLVFALQHWINLTVAFGWLVIMIQLTLAKEAVVWSSRWQADGGQIPSNGSYYAFHVLATLEAIGWGSTLFLFFPAEPIAQAGLVILCVSLAIGSVAVFFCSFSLYLTFCTIIMAAVAARLLLLAEEPYQTLVALMVVLFVVLATVAWRFYQTFVENVRLGLHNKSLADRENVANDVLLQVSKALAEQKEEVLRRTDQMRRFVSIVTHDLQTHMGAIEQLSNSLTEEGLTPERRQRTIAQLKRTTELGMRFVHDVPELATLNTDHLSLKFRKQQLSKVLDNVLSLVKPAAERKGIELISVLSDDAFVSIDGPRIEQVLNNLITNAIKFTPPLGKVTVHTQANEKGIAISIKDNGAGIKPEIINKLFQRDFHHATHSTTRESGIGLGLPTSQEIIQGHGSAISVSSDAGVGSTFSFTLPLASR